jgi:hypothetical protein
LIQTYSLTVKKYSDYKVHPTFKGCKFGKTMQLIFTHHIWYFSAPQWSVLLEMSRNIVLYQKNGIYSIFFNIWTWSPHKLILIQCRFIVTKILTGIWPPTFPNLKFHYVSVSCPLTSSMQQHGLSFEHINLLNCSEYQKLNLIIYVYIMAGSLILFIMSLD